MSILTSNVVDSNMLIRCLVLSQEHFMSSRFFTGKTVFPVYISLPKLSSSFMNIIVKYFELAFVICPYTLSFPHKEIKVMMNLLALCTHCMPMILDLLMTYSGHVVDVFFLFFFLNRFLH